VTIEDLTFGENSHLSIRGTDLVDLTSKYGSPLFVFDQVTLENTFTRFLEVFQRNYQKVMVCYSIKTNNNLAICQLLRQKGAYAEVSSELDFYVALKAGFHCDRMIFDGPFKPKEILRKAIGGRMSLINVESFGELARVNEIAGEMGVKQSVGIRVNPFKDPGLSKYVHINELATAALCNLECRFGFSVQETYSAFQHADELKNVNIEAIMAHPYRVSIKVLLPMIRDLKKKFGVEIKYLNIGGGFNPGGAAFIGTSDLTRDFLRRKMGFKSKLPIGGKGTNLESVIKPIVDQIRQSIGNSIEPTMIVEPGRFLTSASGILLAKVDHVKNAGGYRWVMVDAGTNLLPRFGAIEMRKTVVANKASNEPEEEVNVVGPLLYAEDFVSLKTMLPKVCEGDILAFFDCGAYTLSRSNQFLHARPAAVLLDSKGIVKVIRDRETPDDVLYKDRGIQE
jgi:diaminopimelate decarboxylase